MSHTEQSDATRPWLIPLIASLGELERLSTGDATDGHEWAALLDDLDTTDLQYLPADGQIHLLDKEIASLTLELESAKKKRRAPNEADPSMQGGATPRDHEPVGPLRSSVVEQDGKRWRIVKHKEVDDQGDVQWVEMSKTDMPESNAGPTPAAPTGAIGTTEATTRYGEVRKLRTLFAAIDKDDRHVLDALRKIATAEPTIKRDDINDRAGSYSSQQLSMDELAQLLCECGTKDPDHSFRSSFVREVANVVQSPELRDQAMLRVLPASERLTIVDTADQLEKHCAGCLWAVEGLQEPDLCLKADGGTADSTEPCFLCVLSGATVCRVLCGNCSDFVADVGGGPPDGCLDCDFRNCSAAQVDDLDEMDVNDDLTGLASSKQPFPSTDPLRTDAMPKAIAATVGGKYKYAAGLLTICTREWIDFHVSVNIRLYEKVDQQNKQQVQVQISKLYSTLLSLYEQTSRQNVWNAAVELRLQAAERGINVAEYAGRPMETIRHQDAPEEHEFQVSRRFPAWQDLQEHCV